MGHWGEDGFIDTMTEYLNRHRDIADIPRSQRFANRPSLEAIFDESTIPGRRERDSAIVKAVEEYGYRQREVADHLGMFFTSISRILKAKK